MQRVLPIRPPPGLAGPADAEVTLVGWGSTWGVIHEAVERLAEQGITANHLQIKYVVPFHSDTVAEMLTKARRVLVVENNISGQFAHYLRAQTGIQADALVLKYDGEPFTPDYIVQQVGDIVRGQERSLEVTEAEAREIAYHTIRIKLGDSGRPGQLRKATRRDYQEPVWEVPVVDRRSGDLQGTLVIGADTGATHQWQPGPSADEK
jgi:hypothetical protein